MSAADLCGAVRITAAEPTCKLRAGRKGSRLEIEEGEVTYEWAGDAPDPATVDLLADFANYIHWTGACYRFQYVTPSMLHAWQLDVRRYLAAVATNETPWRKS